MASYIQYHTVRVRIDGLAHACTASLFTEAWLSLSDRWNFGRCDVFSSFVIWSTAIVVITITPGWAVTNWDLCFISGFQPNVHIDGLILIVPLCQPRVHFYYEYDVLSKQDQVSTTIDLKFLEPSDDRACWNILLWGLQFVDVHDKERMKCSASGRVSSIVPIEPEKLARLQRASYDFPDSTAVFRALAVSSGVKACHSTCGNAVWMQSRFQFVGLERWPRIRITLRAHAKNWKHFCQTLN